MAIKEYIYLLGVEDVEASLKRLTEQGEEALGQFRQLGGAGGAEPFAPIAEGSKEAADATEQLTLRSHDLRGAMYILRPILQAAGFEVGQLGTLARLANVGLAGVAAAAAGAVVVGLARLEDAARTTKGQLDDLFQSKALSEKAFAGIQASALQFNTTVASIVPGVEALKVAWDRFITETRTFKFVAPMGGTDIGQIIPPGMVGSVESLQTAYNNFLKLLRAGRLDQTAATEAAKVFFTAMQNGGKVTADILRSLPVGTINLLAQAMGRGQISTQQFVNEVKIAPITLDKLIEALSRFTLESDAAFRANAIITYKDKLGEILNTLSKGFEGLAGISFSDLVIQQLEGIRKGIQDSVTEFEKIKEWIRWIESKTSIPIPWWMQGTVGNRPASIPGGEPAPATGEQINQVWEAAGISAKDAFARGFRNAPAAGADIAKTIQSDAKAAAEQFGKGWIAAPETIAKAAADGANEAASSWDNFFEKLKTKWEDWKKSLSGFSLGISPAGAAEFTGGPLLQQQQAQAQTQPIVAPFQQADDQIRTIWIDLMDYIQRAVSEIDFSSLTMALVQPFSNALPGIRDVLLQVEQMIQEIIRQALQAQQAVQGIGQGRPFSSPGFIEVAGGGLIRGPGTGTSDSIPAFLSNMEYVEPAHRVRQYGVDFMEAIRQGLIPTDAIRNLMNSMRGFRIQMPKIPRFAEGGMVRTESSRTLTLVLDTQRFALSGKSSVIDALERHATLQGMASIGRPPGWVR